MAKLKNLIVNQEEFADLMNTTSRTIRNKITEGMPSLGRKGIPFFEAFRWWLRKVLGEGEGESLTDLKIEKFRIENELKRLQLLLQRGELLPRAEIVNHNVAIIHQTKSAFLALNRILPQKLAGKDPRDQTDIIKREVIGILERFHRGISRGVKVK